MWKERDKGGERVREWWKSEGVAKEREGVAKEREAVAKEWEGVNENNSDSKRGIVWNNANRMKDKIGGKNENVNNEKNQKENNRVKDSREGKGKTEWEREGRTKQ